MAIVKPSNPGCQGHAVSIVVALIGGAAIIIAAIITTQSNQETTRTQLALGWTLTAVVGTQNAPTQTLLPTSAPPSPQTLLPTYTFPPTNKPPIDTEKTMAALGLTQTAVIDIQISLSQTPISTNTSTPTHTDVPTDTPSLTPTSPPTETPIPATQTPRPTRTSEPDTKSGSILKVGEAWRQEEVSLTLTRYELDPGKSRMQQYPINVALVFEFRNRTNETLIFDFKATNFSVEDNLGNQFLYPEFRTPYFGCAVEGVTIRAGQTLNTADDLCTPGPTMLFFEGDITNPKVTELIVTAKEFSRIQLAKWRIPIPH